MKIGYEPFIGLQLHFTPDEIIEALELLKFLKKRAPSMQGQVVAQYFIDLLEEELQGGVQ